MYEIFASLPDFFTFSRNASYSSMCFTSLGIKLIVFSALTLLDVIMAKIRPQKLPNAQNIIASIESKCTLFDSDSNLLKLLKPLSPPFNCSKEIVLSWDIFAPQYLQNTALSSFSLPHLGQNIHLPPFSYYILIIFQKLIFVKLKLNLTKNSCKAKGQIIKC